MQIHSSPKFSGIHFLPKGTDTAAPLGGDGYYAFHPTAKFKALQKELAAVDKAPFESDTYRKAFDKYQADLLELCKTEGVPISDARDIYYPRIFHPDGDYALSGPHVDKWLREREDMTPEIWKEATNPFTGAKAEYPCRKS